MSKDTRWFTARKKQRHGNNSDRRGADDSSNYTKPCESTTCCDDCRFALAPPCVLSTPKQTSLFHSQAYLST